MTNPKITWDHGFLTDCDDATGWIETESSLSATLTVLLGDIFKIEGSPNDPGDEYAHYEKDITDILTSVFTTYVVRYRTSVANNGLKPYISFEFSDGDGYQDVTLDFSQRWKVSTGTILPNNTITHVRLGATDDPNSLASGTYQVYYDFLLICRQIFTFPNVAPGGISLLLPQKTVQLLMPSRGGDIIQSLGMKSPEIVIAGDMKSGKTWGDAILTYGEQLMRIAVRNDPWQWLTFTMGSEDVGFKVVPKTEGFQFDLSSEDKAIMRYRLPFLVHSLSDLADVQWGNIQWMGVT